MLRLATRYHLALRDRTAEKYASELGQEAMSLSVHLGRVATSKLSKRKGESGVLVRMLRRGGSRLND